MKEYITDERTGITYRRVGEVYLPNLISLDTNYPIGIWGERHKDYLLENHRLFLLQSFNHRQTQLISSRD